jgi:hypothetical protein
MSMSLEGISHQALFYSVGGFCMVLILVMLMFVRGYPYIFAIVLMFVGIISIFIGSVTVNCMVVGGCSVLAWIWMIIGLIGILVSMFPR